MHCSAHRSLLATVGTLAALTAVATTAQAKLADADKKVLTELALQWAIEGGISDFKLVKDPSHLVVANFNLPKQVELAVPGRTVVVLSLPRIQAEADFRGDFLYFRFNRFKGDDQKAEVAIALVWAVSVKSTTQYLSGGGATLNFEKHDGKWQLQPVMNRWMS